MSKLEEIEKTEKIEEVEDSGKNFLDEKHSILITPEQLKRNEEIIKKAKEEEKTLEFDNLFMRIMDWKKEKNLDGSLLEIICDFAEEFGYDVVDMGEYLKNDKQFLKIFENDLIENHQIRKKDIKQTSIKDWL